MSRCYLLTGASGVIGSAVVPLLLADGDNQLFLLLRAESPSHLKSRFDDLCLHWGILETDAMRDRMVPMRGDVKEKHLGISDDNYERVCTQVTHIIHAAGNVRMNLDLNSARAETVDVAKCIIDTFHACKQYNENVKLDYVSTIGVCGKLSGSIVESRMSHRAGFNNNYEQSKYESETLLWQLVDAGEAVTIHRPSMVVGDSFTGSIKSFQVFYHLLEFLSGRHTFGVLPRCRDHRIDVIPVDYVAQALIIYSQEVSSIGRVFHLCSGSGAPRIGDLINKVHANNPRKVYMLPVIMFSMLMKLLGLCVSRRYKKKIATLPYFISYLQAKQTFVNIQTCEFF